MKTTHVRLKKTLTLAAAGKMTLAAGSASAALGKADTTPTDQNQLPPVSLDQIGYPLDLLTPPTVGLESGDVEATLGKAGSSSTSFSESSSGTIWAGELAAAAPTDDGSKSGDTTTEPTATQENRIDFIVNGIRNDIPMQVFLAYATGAPNPGAWIPTATGQLQLDPASLQVVAAILTQPVATVAEFPPTPLGHVPPRRSRSVTVPVILSDLSDASLAGNQIRFQAIAIPVGPEGDFQWDQAQVSEEDMYMISRPVEGGSTGSKNSEDASASKSGDTTETDSGGK